MRLSTFDRLALLAFGVVIGGAAEGGAQPQGRGHRWSPTSPTPWSDAPDFAP